MMRHGHLQSRECPMQEASRTASWCASLATSLGLVNLVYTSPADHEDAGHPGHSNNEDSVMYWAVKDCEPFTVPAFLSGEPANTI